LIQDVSGGATPFDAGGAMMLTALRDAVAQIGPLERMSSALDTPIIGERRGVLACPCSAIETRSRVSRDRVASVTGTLAYRTCRRPDAACIRSSCNRFTTAAAKQSPEPVGDGDDVSGCRVMHLPGHAPGLIALIAWRDCPRIRPGSLELGRRPRPQFAHAARRSPFYRQPGQDTERAYSATCRRSSSRALRPSDRTSRSDAPSLRLSRSSRHLLVRKAGNEARSSGATSSAACLAIRCIPR
jgi:hypothetical protein